MGWGTGIPKKNCREGKSLIDEDMSEKVTTEQQRRIETEKHRDICKPI